MVLRLVFADSRTRRPGKMNSYRFCDPLKLLREEHNLLNILMPTCQNPIHNPPMLRSARTSGNVFFVQIARRSMPSALSDFALQCQNPICLATIVGLGTGL